MGGAFRDQPERPIGAESGKKRHETGGSFTAIADYIIGGSPPVFGADRNSV
jgi:hypothetical protein